MMMLALPLLLTAVCTAEALPAAPSQAADSSCDAHPEHVLVRFQEDATPQVRAAAHASAGALQVLREYRHVPGLVLVRVQPGAAAAAIAAYEGEPRVIYAERDAYLRSAVTPNDAGYSLLWGLHNTGQNGGVPDADIDAPEAWSTWTGYQNFVIAVVDTGVQMNHPDLKANIWNNPGEIANGLDDDGNGYFDDLHGINAIDGSGDPSDDHGHGTHCSGTIGAKGNNSIGVVGVNWKCRIAVIKSFGSDGYGLVSDMVEGMDYVIDKGIKVSSNSYGVYRETPQSLYDVIQASQSIGHIFVTSAGNDANDNDDLPQWPAAFDLPNIICVAATNPFDQLASFSNFGASTVDLGAPGESVLSTWINGQYVYADGTSMACPHVAGVVALVWSYAPQLSWQQVRDVVLDNVRPVSALAGKTVTGGVVNAKDAINAVCPPGNPLDIWLDFAFNGLECGTSSKPYDTLAEALDAVAAGGTISIRAGSTNETAPLINKAVTIKAIGGLVTIGQ